MSVYVIDPAEEREHYTLPEVRHRQRVAFGGISATHMIHESTIHATKHPGRYTRRAWDRQALCGSLRACVVGGDASDWPATRQPVDTERVTCTRCLRRYATWLAKAHPVTDPSP